jgi:anti-sigma B factor antagonist
MLISTPALYPAAACPSADVGAATLDPRRGGGTSTVLRVRAFAIHKADLRGAPGIAVEGEVDVSTAPTLELALDEAIRESEGAFVIDLSELEFLDSSGLNVLLRARALLGRGERSLAVVCPPGSPVRRLFELAGVVELLFLYDSRDDVAGELVPPD